MGFPRVLPEWMAGATQPAEVVANDEAALRSAENAVRILRPGRHARPSSRERMPARRLVCCYDLPYGIKAGPAGGRLRRPSSARTPTCRWRKLRS
jgi:hypothetical protein